MRAVLGSTAVTVGKDDEDARSDLDESLDVARSSTARPMAGFGRRPAALAHDRREEYLREFVATGA